jgi:hypothetical protein
MEDTNPLFVRYLLNMNDDYVLNAIMEIYNQQTGFEKRNQMTFQKNGRGFRINHAKLGSRFAELIKRQEKLSFSEMQDAREMILHYCNQLAQLNKEKKELDELKEQNRLRELNQNLQWFTSLKFIPDSACPMNFVDLQRQRKFTAAPIL